MTVKQLIAKIKDLVKQVREATSWAEKFALGVQVTALISEIFEAFADLPEPQMALMAPSANGWKNLMTQHADKSIGMICDELNSNCDGYGKMMPADGNDDDDDSDVELQAAPNGGGRKILEVFLPLLLSLLAKLAGG